MNIIREIAYLTGLTPVELGHLAFLTALLAVLTVCTFAMAVGDWEDD